jgi:peptidoglycan/LPS O-acetylase OafA/YrhL
VDIASDVGTRGVVGPPMSTPVPTTGRLDVLDGWRAVSILAVLACHLVPLGPSSWQLNAAAGPFGMALFFTLSGFLITRFLVRDQHITDFLTRRVFRVVPLAWLAMAIICLAARAPLATWLANFFFYANYPPAHLVEAGAHLWSLCIEVQFYVAVAVVVRLFGRRGLWALPFAGLAITALRVVDGAHVNIQTRYRVDEILAGATLALVFSGWMGPRPAQVIGRLNAYVLVVLLAIASHPSGGFMNYLRPYLAAGLVGVTLFRPPAALGRALRLRPLVYVATVSYALYVIHVPLLSTWLGEGSSKTIIYAKRPLIFLITFGLAHLSTFYFEQPCMGLGRKLSKRLAVRQADRADRAVTAAT